MCEGSTLENKDVFKASPIHVLPIFVSLLFSVPCMAVIQESNVGLETALGLSESGIDPLFTGLMFVCATGFGATLVYLLLKYGLKSIIRLLYSLAFSVLTFSLVLLYLELFLMVVSIEVPALVLYGVAVSAAIYVLLFVILKKGRLYEIVILIFGGATGTLLGATIPLLSAITVLVLLAFYDVFAVFRGPVGKIASKGLASIPGISFSFSDVHVGLGDLVFYSMLVSRMYLSFGWLAFSAASIGVLLGSFFSFKMVEKKGMFPGLPFSILFGLLATFLIEFTV
jgi:presenilin-like A22 family membrane protease